MNIFAIGLFIFNLLLNQIYCDEDMEEIFDRVTYYHYNVDNTEPQISYACVSGTKIYNYMDEIKCVKCKNGTRSYGSYPTECYNCLPNFKTVNANSDNDLQCSECEIGSLALSSESNETIEECVPTNCSQTEYYDKNSQKCIECVEYLPNSIDRPVGTPPLRQYCSCPNNSVKSSFHGIGRTCILNSDNNETLKSAYEKIATLPNKIGVHYFYNVKGNIDLQFYYCDAYHKPLFDEHNCMCNNGFLFYDGKCMTCREIQMLSNQENLDCPCLEGYERTNSECVQCSEGFFKNSFDNIACTQCQENSTSSPDRTECLCLKGYERNEQNCVPCSLGYYKSEDGNGKCSKCPFFKTTSDTGSLTDESCSKLNSNNIAAIVICGIVSIVIIILIAVFSIRKLKKTRVENVVDDHCENNSKDIDNNYVIRE